MSLSRQAIEEFQEIYYHGYPADKALKKSRESIEKIVCYGKWQS
jgi:hypothetical protein